MNERIKDIAEQATKLAEAEYNSQTRQTFLTNKSNRELFNEKFAELIVKECIEVIDLRNRTQFHPTSTGGELLHNVAKDLKQHFGVEE